MNASTPRLGRLWASLFYEFLVVFSLLMVGFWIPETILSAAGLHIPGRLSMLHIFLLLLVYFLWFWLNGGQTLPMKTWCLRLINAEGGPLRPAQVLLRYFAAWPSTLLLVGLLWSLVDRERRFLHDRIAGTRIVAIDAPPTTASPSQPA